MNDLDLSILKCLISNKKHSLDFVNECDAKLFNTDVWNFANIIVNYVKTYKELPTLRVITEKLNKGNNTKLIENLTTTWNQVEQIAYDDKEYKHDLERLKKRYAERQIIAVKESLEKYEPGTMDIARAVGELQKTTQTIAELNKINLYNSKDIKDYLPEFVERFNAKKNNPDIEVGLKTHYSSLDFATNGIKNADFVLIAGASGFGKSLLLKNIAVQSWMQLNTIDTIDNFSPGKNIIYFSLEMPYEDCFNRLISRLSGVNTREIENASLNKEDFAKVKKALNFIKNFPYQFKIVDIADANANDIEKILLDNTNFDAIFVDYLGIMKTNDKKSEEKDWLTQGVVAYELRGIARKYKLPVFSAVQLNRKSNTGDPSENIGLNRLARSGTIATHATHVIQIENRPNEEQFPDFICHIIKNRKGPKLKMSFWKRLSSASLIDKDAENVPSENMFTDVDDISREMEDLDI